MAPRKRKTAVAEADSGPEDSSTVDAEDAAGQPAQPSMTKEEIRAAVKARLLQMEQEVEEQIEAMLAAAQKVIGSFVEEFNQHIAIIPPEIRAMPYGQWLQMQERAAFAGPTAVDQLESSMAAAQQAAMAAIAPATATRSLRSRTAAPATAAPATTRRGRTARAAATPLPSEPPPQARPKAPPQQQLEGGSARANAASPAAATTPGPAAAGHAHMGPELQPRATANAAAAAGPASADPKHSAAVGKPDQQQGAGASLPATQVFTQHAQQRNEQQELRERQQQQQEEEGGKENAGNSSRAAMMQRARARVDAKLAAVEASAAALRPPAQRDLAPAAQAPDAPSTTVRHMQPGEQAFSANGSPLYVVNDNVTRVRGRGAGIVLPTPALPRMPVATRSTAALGFTVAKRQGAAAAAAAAGPATRRRAAKKEQAVAEPVLITHDGQTYDVGPHASLDHVPQPLREYLQILKDAWNVR